MVDTTDKSKTANRKMVPLHYVLTPIMLILVAIVIVAILAFTAEKPAKKPPEINAPLVQVIKLSSQNITFNISSQGTVMPRTETRLISEVSGVITDVADKFNVGGFFSKGETLLVIDDISYKAAVLQAQSQEDGATATLIEEQAKSDQKKEEWLLSGKPLEQAPILALRIPQLQQAKAGLKAAQANLQDAKIKLKRTVIKTPYDALIKAKNVDIGQYVTLGSTLASIFAVDYAEVRLPIKQKDILFLNLPRVNQSQKDASKVEINFQLGNDSFSLPSQITRYEGEVDRASRVHYVIAQINDPYQIKSERKMPELRMGMYVNAKISGKTMTAITAIPRRSVHGSNTIYLMSNDNKLHIEKINIFRTDAEHVYTRDTIAANLQLITTKLATPVNGMPLRLASDKIVKDAKAKITSVTNAKQGE
ncbi:MAG: efflux RND transporter periplasmic adaptor subunit [Alteromonadaceae bacterium]|nr:efflux RND transporter periplasmic adaptor subunit [Alteromonadaceae bacterium]